MTAPDPQPRLIPEHDDYTVPCPECNGTRVAPRYTNLAPAQAWLACHLCKGSGRVSDLLDRQHRLLMRSND